ncbi:MAG: pseudouridine synthase [Phycisphaerae bacterium]
MRKGKMSPSDGPLGGATIVFEDADLLVVDKPAGLISARPGDQTAGTLFHFVKQYLRSRSGRSRQAGGPGGWIIHRLDRDVSGLLVFAKTHTAYLALKDQLKRRQVHRRYLAVVQGELPVTPEGEWKWIDAFLADSGPDRPVRLVGAPEATRRRPGLTARDPEAPMRAVTYYRVLAAARGQSLLAVRLETGRKHQIRAHLAGQGHPVLGDRLYGAPRAQTSRRLALHAWELTFAHPATGQNVQFTSAPPEEFFTLAGASSDLLAREARAADVPPPAPAQPSLPPSKTPPRETGWDNVAQWYEGLIERRRSDYHEDLVVPGVLRLLSPRKGQRVLDVACGEGVLCRRLAELGVECVGVDASEQLVAAAQRLTQSHPGKTPPRFLVGDARCLEQRPELAGQKGSFDAAVCVLALMNIDPFEPVLRGVAAMLKPGGTFTVVIMHPAFRSPGQTAWGWDTPRQTPAMHRQRGGKGRAELSAVRQYRRVDAYLSPAHQAIVMNPGQAAHGKAAVTTLTWHRPIQTYIKAFAEAHLLVDALEEWASHRVSEPGPRAAEQDRARREIPMFLALRGRRCL